MGGATGSIMPRAPLAEGRAKLSPRQTRYIILLYVFLVPRASVMFPSPLSHIEFFFCFVFFTTILIQEEVAPKRCNPVVRGGPLYRENKKRFKGWVGVEGNCGCWSYRIEGYKLLGRR